MEAYPEASSAIFFAIQYLAASAVPTKVRLLQQKNVEIGSSASILFSELIGTMLVLPMPHQLVRSFVSGQGVVDVRWSSPLELCTKVSYNVLISE
jgi:hypothetical protein